MVRGPSNGGRGPRLTYANVMATIAVFGVLAGGGAWAADKIGSDDIDRNAVRSKHIKKRAVKKSDLAKNAIRFDGTGSLQSGSVENATSAPKTLVTLPGLGRIVATCAFGGSGNTQTKFENTSGRTLIVSTVGGRNEFDTPFFERHEVDDGDEVFLAATGSGTNYNARWASIVPPGSGHRPLAMATATAEHLCGKTTAFVLSTER